MFAQPIVAPAVPADGLAKPNRRSFLKGASALGGALVIAAHLPLARRAMAATGDLAPNARRIITAVDQLRLDVPLSVEVPRLHGAEPSASWWGALDDLAAVDHRLKLRTGGPDEGAFRAALAPVSPALAA